MKFKNEKLATKLYKYGSKLMSISVYLWLFETFMFIWIYGWHWSAFNEIEQKFDNAVALLFGISIGFYVVAFLLFTDDLFTSKSPSNENS